MILLNQHAIVQGLLDATAMDKKAALSRLGGALFRGAGRMMTGVAPKTGLKMRQAGANLGARGNIIQATKAYNKSLSAMDMPGTAAKYAEKGNARLSKARNMVQPYGGKVDDVVPKADRELLDNSISIRNAEREVAERATPQADSIPNVSPTPAHAPKPVPTPTPKPTKAALKIYNEKLTKLKEDRARIEADRRKLGEDRYAVLMAQNKKDIRAVNRLIKPTTRNTGPKPQAEIVEDVMAAEAPPSTLSRAGAAAGGIVAGGAGAGYLAHNMGYGEGQAEVDTKLKEQAKAFAEKRQQDMQAIAQNYNATNGNWLNRLINVFTGGDTEAIRKLFDRTSYTNDNMLATILSEANKKA